MTQGKIFDLILRGGHVVDPAAGRDGLFDVGIRAGKIASVRSGLKGARRVIDVSGGYVLPDLIDAHVYRHVTGRFGLKADWVGVRSGVATVVDQEGPQCVSRAAPTQAPICTHPIRPGVCGRVAGHGDPAPV